MLSVFWNIFILGNATFILFVLSVYVLTVDTELLPWLRSRLDFGQSRQLDLAQSLEERAASRS